MPTNLGRVLEVGIGVFFVVAAFLKALDMEAFSIQIALYRVLEADGLIYAAAYATVVVETLIGAALIGGWQRRAPVYVAAGLMTLVYTGLIAYAWAYHDLEDCGCFGKYVQMGPASSITKNVVLIGLLALAWYLVPRSEQSRRIPGRPLWTHVGAALSVVLVLGALAYGYSAAEPGSETARTSGPIDRERPFATFQFELDGKQYDLGQGEYLVAMLSATCEHCQASVPMLNELYIAAEDIEMLALMLGSAEETENFRLFTDPLFPMQIIEPIDFFKLVDKAPPRLVHARDGVSVTHWDWEEEPPSPQSVLETARGTE